MLKDAESIAVCRDYCRLSPEGLVAAAPPCSLYGPAAASVHKRSDSNPLGDLGNFKVRLARRIWLSFASWTQAWSVLG